MMNGKPDKAVMPISGAAIIGANDAPNVRAMPVTPAAEDRVQRRRAHVIIDMKPIRHNALHHETACNCIQGK